MSPMNRACRGSFPTTSAQCFQPAGRRSAKKNSESAAARSRRPRRTKLPATAPFVGRVVVAGSAAVRAPLLEAPPVLLERVRRAAARAAATAPRPGSSAIVVEVASKSPRSARSRHVVEPPRRDHGADRGVQVRAQLVARRGDPRTRRRLAEAAGERRPPSESPRTRPEVVPVGMHRMGRVALVADRLGEEAEEEALPAAPVLVGAALAAQRVDVAPRPSPVPARRLPPWRGRRCTRGTRRRGKSNSPWLSCSGTGSAPRASTQHGTAPFSEYVRREPARGTRAPRPQWPRRSSAVGVSAPSRIHERA